MFHVPSRNLRLFTRMFALAAFCLAGCARVADPMPPLLHIPRPADSLKMKQVGNQITLQFRLPTHNIDGSPIQVLQEVRLYRCLRPDGPAPVPPEADQLRQAGFLIAAMKGKELEKYKSGDTIQLTDDLGSVQGADPYRNLLYYAVECTGKRNRSAGLSGIQQIRPVAVARPVTLRAALQPEAVRLEWDMPQANIDGSTPARITGYRLYRSFEEPPRFDRPLNTTPPERTWYEDRDFVFGRKARYAVGVVAGMGDPGAESVLSESILVDPRDIFPPAVPRNLEAFGTGDAISLRWDANRESDLLGYFVYRSETESDIGRRLTEKAIEQTAHTDRDVERQKTYYYRLTAVDKPGNESKPTPPVAGNASNPQ